MIHKILRSIMVPMAMIFLTVITYATGGLVVESEKPLTPKPDQALIVFMRLPASFGKAFLYDDYGQSVSLYEVSGNENKFIGLSKGGTKVSYDSTPGEHTFMVVGEAADFMKATVAAGKTYYVLVTSRMGLWQARYSLRPLHQHELTSTSFPRWDSNTVLVENTPESEEWAQKNASTIEIRRARYWSVWSAKTQEQRDLHALNPEDGR
jgi:hypothetical protein